MKRVTFTDPLHSEPKTVNHTMLIHGINAIVRTARMEAAARTQPRADQLLIQLDQQDGGLGGDAHKAARMAAVRGIAGILPAFRMRDRCHMPVWLSAGFLR